MPQPFGRRREAAHAPVEILGLGCERAPVDPRPPVRGQHRGDFVERQAGDAPECDQREPFEHGGVILAASQPAEVALCESCTGSSTEWAGNYPFRFIKDTRTGTCFLVSLSGGEGGSGRPTVTAIARAENASCN